MSVNKQFKRTNQNNSSSKNMPSCEQIKVSDMTPLTCDSLSIEELKKLGESITAPNINVPGSGNRRKSITEQFLKESKK